VHKEVKDTEGRIILIEITINDEDYVLVNYYAPTKDNLSEQIKCLNNLKDILVDFSDKQFIIGGDFNCCLNPGIDKRGDTIEKASACAESIQDTMNELNLCDIWRIRNPEAQRYTHRQNTRAGIVFSRIDFFLISMHLSYAVQSSEIHTGTHSDHSIIDLTLNKAVNDQKGKGFWKFNNSLLFDNLYVGKIKEKIEYFKANNTTNVDGLAWDLLKCQIRGETISYATYKSKQTRELENKLKRELEVYDESAPLNIHEYEKYVATAKELDQIQCQHAMGTFIRSRAQYLDEGERNAKYFLSLEKRNYNIKHIQCLIGEDDILITEPNKILEEEVKFYEALYSDNEQETEEPTFFENIKTLDESAKHICDADITMEE
jgi:hypothetical protein